MTVHLPKASRRARRHLRVATTWIVLLAFAAIAVPGQGLHLLPGMEHSHGAADGCCQARGQSAQNAGWDASHGSSFDHANGCAICQFAAEGKIVPHPPACGSCDATVTYLATADCPVLSGQCDQPFFARGPPQG